MNNVKQVVKNTGMFQRKKMDRYISGRSESFAKLSAEEKPRRFLLCKNSSTNQKSKVDQLLKMLNEIHIQIDPEKRFQTWIDTGLYVYKHFSLTDNTPPQYGLVINSSLEDLRELCDKKSEFGKEQCRFIEGIFKYVERIIKELDNSIELEKDPIHIEKLINTRSAFHNMLHKKAYTIEEGFQRILFWSSLFWQTQHRLVGIGRLDKVLANLIMPEKEEDLIVIIKDFYEAMHKYYAFKSNDLLGDTGQIIEIGGKEPNGTYFCNRLTYAFIKASIEQRLPDPKLLLRVCSNTGEDLINLSIDCISTGVGYPLLANDDVIIPAISSLYETEDSYDYVTSACWEPLIYGRSLDKNNIDGINFASVFVSTYKDSEFDKCRNLEDIMALYFSYLKNEMNRIIDKMDAMRWEPDPLASLFISDCMMNNCDISEGGAKYNNYGVLGVGLGNAVNSLLIIKELAFESNMYTLSELKNACLNNYDNYNEIAESLSKSDYYGTDNDLAVDLTHKIVEYVYSYFKNYKNRFGGVLKFGLSASNYKEVGNMTEATMDGRHNGDPLGVHISSHRSNGYTELVNFAGKLNYNDIRCNGNVVDFFITPNLILENKKKFCEFILLAIKNGFFQMQMNVVDSKTLIDAKIHPEKYKTLIVRVWGFSAYFNDLPESYKDILIKRAKQNEGVA